MTVGHTPDLLATLNPEQREAAEFFEGPLLVLAGAGSGKTRVLTTRIAHLIREHGVPASRVLAVTFTNKAAGEMRERVTRLLGGQPAGMWIGTFHAIGARMLRRHAPQLGWDRTFSIYDADQSLRAVKRAMEDAQMDTRRWSPKGVRAAISGAKNQLVDAAQFRKENEGSFDFFTRQVARIYPIYQQSLKQQNAFDFDDLLTKPVELLETATDLLETYTERFAFILVDEYQDTNRAQFRLLELLASRHQNLMVVGDDDQSIYGWRGADIRNILDFEKTYPDAHVVRLEQNYRSSARILAAANAVISENTERKGKTLRTDRPAGDIVTVTATADEMDEARTIVEELERTMLARPELNHRSFAVLYRTNAQSRALEEAFLRRGVPYQIVGGVRFYERREIQDVLAYLRLLANPRDQVAFDRIVNYPRRGVGAKTQERLRAHMAETGRGPLEVAANAGDVEGVGAGAVRALAEFAGLVRRLADLAREVPVGDVVQSLVEELDLLLALRDEGPEGEDRADNVRELIAGALEFDAELLEDLEDEEREQFTDLELFLQRVALVADVDRMDPEADAVVLMTLHNAKGLEFPVVFISGMEDGLFPLSRAYDAQETMEEERRLFYVGVTRAMDTLQLTHCRRRRRAGEMMIGRLSPFVSGIPDELREEHTSARLRRERPRRIEMEWGRSSRSERGVGSVTEPAYDPDFDFESGLDQDQPRMVKGERVLHDTFGSGRIMEITGVGRDVKITVDFESIGRKKLLARYAGLRRDFD